MRADPMSAASVIAGFSFFLMGWLLLLQSNISICDASFADDFSEVSFARESLGVEILGSMFEFISMVSDCFSVLLNESDRLVWLIDVDSVSLMGLIR